MQRAPDLQSTSSVIGRKADRLFRGALGGIDGFVFAAGVGENKTPIRHDRCRTLHLARIEGRRCRERTPRIAPSSK